MPVINCKVELSLKWIENCILSVEGKSATFKINDAELYVPHVTLSTEDNAKFSKLLSEGFNRPVYWNKCKVVSNESEAGPDNNPKKHKKNLQLI